MALDCDEWVFYVLLGLGSEQRNKLSWLWRVTGVGVWMMGTKSIILDISSEPSLHRHLRHNCAAATNKMKSFQQSHGHARHYYWHLL